MTSSLRNSIHRPSHKERSQLAHRLKYGILEKHSDYLRRARDYHSKQDRLARLRQKAAQRNKDEFYFAMVNEKTKGGVHVKDRGNTALPTDIVKVLKTQDENYVRTMRMANLRRIDNLKRQLTEMVDLTKAADISQDSGDDESLDSREAQILRETGILPSLRKGKSPKHIVFVDTDEEAQKLASRIDHAPSKVEQAEKSPQNVDLGWKAPTKGKHKKKVKKTLASKSDRVDIEDNDERDQGEKSHRGRIRLLKELSARFVRDTQLRYAQREFEMQRLMMGKGARKKISAAEKVEGDDVDEDEDEIDAYKGRRIQTTRKVDETLYKPRVYKWKLERKR